MTFTEQELKTIKFAVTRQSIRTSEQNDIDAKNGAVTEEGKQIEKELFELMLKLVDVR